MGGGGNKNPPPDTSRTSSLISYFQLHNFLISKENISSWIRFQNCCNRCGSGEKGCLKCVGRGTGKRHFCVTYIFRTSMLYRSEIAITQQCFHHKQTPKTASPLSPSCYRSAHSSIPDFVSVELLKQYFSQRDNDLKDKNNKSILKGSLSGVISHLETTKRGSLPLIPKPTAPLETHTMRAFRKGIRLLLREFLSFKSPKTKEHEKDPRIH